MENESEVYKSKICVLCTNRDSCSKDKFKRYVIGDKISTRCPEYKYEFAKTDEFIVY